MSAAWVRLESGLIRGVEGTSIPFFDYWRVCMDIDGLGLGFWARFCWAWSIPTATRAISRVMAAGHVVFAEIMLLPNGQSKGCG